MFVKWGDIYINKQILIHLLRYIMHMFTFQILHVAIDHVERGKAPALIEGFPEATV